MTGTVAVLGQRPDGAVAVVVALGVAAIPRGVQLDPGLVVLLLPLPADDAVRPGDAAAAAVDLLAHRPGAAAAARAVRRVPVPPPPVVGPQHREVGAEAGQAELDGAEHKGPERGARQVALQIDGEHFHEADDADDAAPGDSRDRW